MFKNFALVALLVISGVMLAAPVVAQNTWRIDPEHSTARLVLASSRNPDAGVNVGVARASGVIDQNGGDSSNPNFDFTIWPADRNGGKISDDPASDPTTPSSASNRHALFP